MTARLFARSGVVARCTFLVNSSRYLPHWFWLGAAALWLMAALLRWWMGPAFELLPTDYVQETSYAAKLWSRQTLSSESIVRRRAHTLSSRDGHSVIEADAHWLTPRIVTFDHGDMRAFELWMPLTFATPGLIWIGAGFYTLRRGAK